MDIALVLDLSGSIETVYNAIMNFALKVVQGLPMQFERTRIGVITFASSAKIEFDLYAHSSQEEVLNAMTFGKSRGSTNTQDALQLLYNDLFTPSRGDRSGVDNIAVIVTDGGSNVLKGIVFSNNRGKDPFFKVFFLIHLFFRSIH